MITGFQWFWRFIAWLIVRPRVVSLIIRIAKRHPYSHIGQYMGRWWLMPRWTLKRMPTGEYMVRDWMPFSVRIHHIMKEDADPYLHDHPWNWRTIILDNGYQEEDVFGELHIRGPRFTAGRTAETFHRIEYVAGLGAWTLFIMGRRRNKWGFLVGNPARKVYWKDYVSVNGRAE